MPTKTPSISADDVIAKAERVRRRAQEIAEHYPQYSDLIGQPSGWCVVTEFGFWSLAFHSMLDEDVLRERINRGRKVILTLGLVAALGSKLTATDHVAVVSQSNPEKPSRKRLEVMVARAKRCAVSALFR
jgi:hypothetical protein